MRTKELEKSRNHNRKKSRESFPETIRLIENCFNTQKEYAMMFSGFMGQRHFTGHTEAEKPIISAIFKNEVALYSAFLLTEEGFHGAGSIHLRSVFEALMIAKFSSLVKVDPIIDRWISGETIYFSNAILKNIINPKTNELQALWRTLCRHSHATIYSYQIGTEFDENHEYIYGNFIMIIMLLSCNFHLINRHFVTPAMVRMGKLYYEDGEFKKKTENAKLAVKEANQSLSKKGRALVRKYSASWKLKTSNN